MLAAVEPAASVAEFTNDTPDILKVYLELKAQTRRTDRIMQWLSVKYPGDWSGEHGGT